MDEASCDLFENGKVFTIYLTLYSKSLTQLNFAWGVLEDHFVIYLISPSSISSYTFLDTNKQSLQNTDIFTMKKNKDFLFQINLTFILLSTLLINE